MADYIDTFPGRSLQLHGSQYLYFGGTAYLGLQTDAEFQQLFISNIQKYGTNYGASRKANLRISIFKEVESMLGSWVGSEACTTLSSGYLAGQFVVRQMSGPKYRFFYAPNTHSALFAAKTKSYTTFATLNIALRQHLETNPSETPVVFLDSIDFSGSNFPHFKALRTLPLAQLILVVDDSHGIGIVGEQGRGVFEKITSLAPKELIVCCSLGKGFGVQAGAVFGTKQRIEQMTDSDFFGGASPASPAALATLYQATDIYQRKRQLLKRNLQLFKERVLDITHFLSMPQHPAFTYRDDALTQYLKRKDILVTSFRYPDQKADLVSRIILSAAHTPTDILTLCAALNSYKE